MEIRRSHHEGKKKPNNDCRTALTWTTEGRRKRGRPKTTWRKTAEREREKAGWKNWSEVQIAAAVTELVGGNVLRPYVPHGTKKTGNR